jgi:pyruvate-ferredoxin/flavodoxin oxidoreductase
MGAKDEHTLKAFLEAEAYPGASLIIAYSHCIAHGYDMARGLDQQKLAVESAYWPLYRFDPRLSATGKSPLQLDSAAPRINLSQFAQNEARFRIVEQQSQDRYKQLLNTAQQDIAARFRHYQALSLERNGAEAQSPTAKGHS